VLDDLKSRAQAAGVHRLPRLDDTGLAEAISRHAAKRGLDLDDAARNYLLRRLSREIADITSWLDRVDAYALAAQRRITVPLLRELMES
jgi:DnaA family protein